jgi:endonuclease/exonuclease/phosphatase family metal-dependent hydrolase
MSCTNPVRLRIGTYNIAHARGIGGNSRWRVDKRESLLECLDGIARTLNNERLDLLVLNEVDGNSFRTRGMNQVQYLAGRLQLPFHAHHCFINVSLGPLKLRYGNAVFSRYPISQVTHVPFPGHSLWESALLGKKAGLLCRVSLPSGREIRLMAVHLEHRLESNRLAAARRIEEVRKASPLPLLLAGDFNSTMMGFPHAASDPGGQTAVSWLLSTGAYRTRPFAPPQEGDMTFMATRPLSVIDWILVPAHWTILEKRVLSCTLSDHYPVIMEAEFADQNS